MKTRKAPKMTKSEVGRSWVVIAPNGVGWVEWSTRAAKRRYKKLRKSLWKE